MSQHKTSANHKVRIITGASPKEIIQRLFRDRDKLEGLLATGRNCDGEIYFYDSGGDIIEDLGILECIKQTVLRGPKANT